MVWKKEKERLHGWLAISNVAVDAVSMGDTADLAISAMGASPGAVTVTVTAAAIVSQL